MTSSSSARAVFRVDLPWSKPPLSLNDRLNHHAKARLTREVREAAGWAVKATALGRHERISARLHYQPARAGRRDTDNLHGTGKPCFDAIVDAGVVPDDTPEHMVKPEPVIWHPVKGQPGRLWLEIEVLA